MGQNSAARERRRDSGSGRSINKLSAAAAAAAAAAAFQPVETMLSLQDSVFFEISIKSLLKAWSSSCKYTCLHGGSAEVGSVPFFAC